MPRPKCVMPTLKWMIPTFKCIIPTLKWMIPADKLMRPLWAQILLTLLLSLVVTANEHDHYIEEVNDRELEKVVEMHDFVAVFWFVPKKCKLCEPALEVLETIDDDADRYGVTFVKISNKKYARNMGIKHFPAVSFYKAGDMMMYTGDVLDSDAVLKFITSEEALELPDKIESVDAENLFRVVEEESHVAVFFYEEYKRESTVALQHMELIDDEADKFGISFVRIIDSALAEDYSLHSLPALAYFRHATPILYTGDINNEEEVFEFLFQNKHTADEEMMVEEVDSEKLDILINHVDFVVVLFYKKNDPNSARAIQEIDSIDDDLKERGVSIVKTTSQVMIDMYDVDFLPKVVYFESEIPTFWPDEKLLDSNETMLTWVRQNQDADQIEEINEEMLGKLISTTDQIAIFFYNRRDKGNYETILDGLETIDDELDTYEIPFVKISSKDVSVEFGFEKIPALAFFQRGIPAYYEGDIADESEVLKWFLLEADLWVEPPVVEQLFILEGVRAEVEWAVEETPTLVLFESEEPQFYKGHINDTAAVIQWLKQFVKVEAEQEEEKEEDKEKE